jgi:phosphate:Na+ symporter
MTAQFDYWGLIAGVALFLFAMVQLESGLKTLGGRSLALYLKRQTGRSINAVIGGIVSTALLQSSSVVALMALAFTGAGLLTLTAALGIIFGSNLGTTLTGWIVATIGFKLEIFRLSLPLIGIGGLVYVFTRERWAEYGRAVLGLGLLLMGLQLMKTSVASLEELIDISDLANLAPWQYLLFGTVVAAVIQSSSATMMIALTALYAGIIDLPNAAAIAIGADLGTTTTVMIGAIRGSATKQQVAAGHVLFNVITDAIAFALRMPLLALIAWAGVDDPLYALVAFHSLFNFIGLCIFLPVTGKFAGLLQRLIPEREQQESRYLHEVRGGVGAAAIDAAERETSLLIARATRLQMNVFDPELTQPEGTPPVPHRRGIKQAKLLPFGKLYSATKTLEGELLEFAIRLQAGPLQPHESARISQLLEAAREAMHSAKAVKDIRHNLHAFEQSGDSAIHQYAQGFRDAMQDFLRDLYALREDRGEDERTAIVSFEELAAAMQRIEKRHSAFHERIYADVRSDRIAESRVSSLLNVNRELLTANRSLLLALGCYYLNAQQQEDLEHLPL